MDFMNTVKGSLLEGFYPAGWDMTRIDACCSQDPSSVLEPQPFWHKEFQPIPCETVADFNTKMGHEIALQIKKARDEGRKLALILPVGPMGMYRWAVYFLKEWQVPCDHVTTFNMDEWADSEGNTLAANDPAAFQNAMKQAFFDKLSALTVPEAQRNFATRDNLPTYPNKIAALKKEGAVLTLVFGIGRMCHIAFWEPHFAAEFSSKEEWLSQNFRLGAKLHPLTIEQNAIMLLIEPGTSINMYTKLTAINCFLTYLKSYRNEESNS